MAILDAIIETYIELAEPVGSKLLTQRFGFPLSSATIRNEMADLERMGFICQPYTSAGRVPTESGYRFYVNNLLDRYEVALREQNAIKKKLLSMQRFERALETAAQTLAERTDCAAIAASGENIYFSGMSNIFRQPDFYRSPLQALRIAEIFDNLLHLINELPDGEEINIYIGDENPIGKDANCSFIVSRFQTPFNTEGFVGVLGLTRMPYEKSISLVKLVSEYLEEM
ncbi:MAG: Transcriptional regulator of heat shock protein [candidate division CPR2 bacterium GW2011_GWC1_41_48]|uniref:Transcriptional regulator of heat shock protein n=1 Tax=candidate division CPR2 bacterium GW2011_GWC1_41_48 TaxID=1618344 RepID=A0A0G0Z6G2_UNCC2|nr:MAG: Transcriptional regulator of heat shock protein [candidate division CPR2 bacterium GW2011_GWC2_39_35]KKS08613.1 MAG: Transcriptional regulator of heat shock protein [candidate division CPR2 bacterium GW2011_GWC1_41_48]